MAATLHALPTLATHALAHAPVAHMTLAHGVTFVGALARARAGTGARSMALHRPTARMTLHASVCLALRAHRAFGCAGCLGAHAAMATAMPIGVGQRTGAGNNKTCGSEDGEDVSFHGTTPISEEKERLEAPLGTRCPNASGRQTRPAVGSAIAGAKLRRCLAFRRAATRRYKTARKKPTKGPGRARQKAQHS